MKPIKTLGFAALTALMAMAFVGASTAMAEHTQLCKASESLCAAGNVVTEIHESTVTDALLLNSLGRVKCKVLFLSTSVGPLASPQVIEGNFKYESCFRKKLFSGEEACEVEEINGPVEIKILKNGHETAKVTGEGEVKVTCGSVIECIYNGKGLEGTAKGPALSTQTNGEVTLSEQTTTVVSGAFCPETAKLDITTTPLTKTYIST